MTEHGKHAFHERDEHGILVRPALASDVPHIQYLRAPLAMHVAFWHEDFGNPKSAECVNVAPIDGKFLFEWTDPKLPEGWGGMRPGGGNGDATPVVITGM